MKPDKKSSLEAQGGDHALGSQGHMITWSHDQLSVC